MSLKSRLRALRVVIILMTLCGCANFVLEYPATHDLDRLNSYLSFALIVGYSFALTSNFRIVAAYTRALLMILIAFIWFSFNMTWSFSRFMHGRDLWRLDVTVSLPTSLLIVIESVLTLKWEARQKRQEEVIKACREQEIMSVVSLPQDEQDHVEVVIPENLQYWPSRGAAIRGEDQVSIRLMDKREVYQRPPQAYFPGSPVLPSTSSSSSSSHRHQRQMYSGGRPHTEQLPPYSQI